MVALADVSFSINTGDFLGICGENGAGKSTLMKILSGSYSHTEYTGEILVDGKPAKITSIQDSQKLGVEMTYQEQNVMLDATVAENLMVGNLPGGRMVVNFKEMYATVEKFLREMNLNLDPRQTLRTVSNGGQIQMISIMRAVLKHPRILVLDEPTTALTDNEVEIVFNMLNRLRKEGITCIYISHKLEEVFRMCDKVMVLRDGHMISMHEDIREVTRDSLISEMIGRELSNTYHHKDVHTDEVVLSVRNMRIRNPNNAAINIIDDMSFDLHKGEVLGLGGLVGAGRSEILGAIFAQITQGVSREVTLNGESVSIKKPMDAIRLGIGYLTEERRSSGLVVQMTVRENISLASLKDLAGGLAINAEDERAKTRKVFEDLHIKAPSLETLVGTLSGGNQQKVVLAKWLMTNCRVLFLDEPTKGIDVGAKSEFYQIIDALTEQGISIVLVSSDMPEFISLCDRCLVIADGGVRAELIGSQITQENIMRAVV